MDRRSPISPPGTRPHPAQSNEFIGDQTLLPTLATRHLISALTYLYKFQCISGPAQLSKVLFHFPPYPLLISEPVLNMRSPPVSTFLSATGSLTRLLYPFISLLCPQLLEVTSNDRYLATPLLEWSAAVRDNGLPPPLTQGLDEVYWPVLNAVPLPLCLFNNFHIDPNCHWTLFSFFFFFPFLFPS